MTAVNSALNGNPFGAPGSINDPARQAQLYHYLETLKTDENGWRKSTDNIIADNLSTDEEHFLLLQVIEDYLARRYAGADADSVMCIRSLLSHWIQKLSNRPDQPGFLINKMAHIFSLVFAADFPDRWPTFMDDIFLSRGLDSVPLVVFYLKTLVAIDSEVMDRDIQRTKTLFDCNSKIEDFMRDLCIPQIVQSWLRVLEHCSDMIAQRLCLNAIAAFVDRVNVELVANDVFVALEIAMLDSKDISEAAVLAVSALIKKGMPPSKKLSFVTALSNVLPNNQLINVNPNSNYEDVLRARSLLGVVRTVVIDTYHKMRVSNVASRSIDTREPTTNTTSSSIRQPKEMDFDSSRKTQVLPSRKRSDISTHDAVTMKLCQTMDNVNSGRTREADGFEAISYPALFAKPTPTTQGELDS